MGARCLPIPDARGIAYPNVRAIEQAAHRNSVRAVGRVFTADGCTQSANRKSDLRVRSLPDVRDIPQQQACRSGFFIASQLC